MAVFARYCAPQEDQSGSAADWRSSKSGYQEDDGRPNYPKRSRRPRERELSGRWCHAPATCGLHRSWCAVVYAWSGNRLRSVQLCGCPRARHGRLLDGLLPLPDQGITSTTMPEVPWLRGSRSSPSQCSWRCRTLRHVICCARQVQNFNERRRGSARLLMTHHADSETVSWSVWRSRAARRSVHAEARSQETQAFVLVLSRRGRPWRRLPRSQSLRGLRAVCVAALPCFMGRPERRRNDSRARHRKVACS